MYFKLGLTFLFIITILSLSGIYIYKTNTDKMHEQLENYDRTIVGNMSNSMIKCLNDIHNIFHNIYSINNDLVDNRTEEIDYRAFRMLKDYLSYTVSSYEYVYDIVIYPSSDLSVALTSQGSYSVINVFEKIFHNASYPVSFWLNYEPADKNILILPSSVYENKLLGTRENLIVALSNRKSIYTDYNIVIFIDKDKIFKIPAERKLLDKSAYAVFDSNRNLILSENLTKLKLQDIRYSIDTSRKEMEFELGNSKYYMVFTDLHKYIVVNKFSDRSILSDVKENNMLTITLAAFIGFTISLIAIIILYRPLKRILNHIDLKNSNINVSNPFNVIDREIQSLKDRTLSLTQTLSSLKEADICNNFRKALSGINTTEDDINKVFSSVRDENGKINNYIIVITNLESKNVNNITGISGDRKISPKIKKDFIKLWKSTFNCSISFQFSSKGYTSLVNLEENISNTRLESIMEKFIEDFYHLFDNVKLAIHVSNFYSSPYDIAKAHIEASKSIEFKPVTSKSKVFYYNSIYRPQNPYLTFDILEKYKNHLMTGNKKECVSAFNEIIAKNVNLNLDMFTFKNVCYRLLRTIYQVAPDSIVNQFNRQQNFITLTTRLYSLNSVDDFLDFFDSVIGSFTGFIQNELNFKTMSSREKINYIQEYIRLHYNEDLYLEKLSDMINLSPKYFSNHFKQVAGVNFTEYLNKVRVMHAKELLKDSSLTLNDISHMVGYKSSSAFSINFSKYQGMTPNKYRILTPSCRKDNF